MTHLVVRIAVVLLAGVAAEAAENATQMETFLGYSLTRVNSASGVSPFIMNGGSGQFVYNANNWVGAVLDLGATYNGNIHNINVDSTLTNFLLGPRVAVRRWSRITPYVQTLFGGVYSTSSAAFPIMTQVTNILPGSNVRLVNQQTAFAMTAGGGLDIKINKHVSFRPFQAEYFLTRLHQFPVAGNRNQNNFRYSAGLNFTFGRGY